MKDSVSFLVEGKVFNRYQLFSMDHREENQARINGAVNKFSLAANLGQNHGACSAVTFSTPLLYSLEGRKGTKKSQYRGSGFKYGGIRKSNFHDAVIKDKTDGFLHILSFYRVKEKDVFLTSIILAPSFRRVDPWDQTLCGV